MTSAADVVNLVFAENKTKIKENTFQDYMAAMLPAMDKWVEEHPKEAAQWQAI